MSELDDGWTLETAPTETAATRDLDDRGRSRLELIREALRILDGDAPQELELEGEGWSLIDPASVNAPKAAEEHTPVVEVAQSSESSGGVLATAMRHALDQALSEGWLLANDDAPHEEPLFSSEEAAFFQAGDELALTSSPPEGEYAEEPSRWKRILRKSA